MSQRSTLALCVLMALAGVSTAYAHHAMDYQLPATLLEGLLSGLGHPIIGMDHLLFILGAGVLAAHLERGPLLALLFVVGSMLAAAARAGGAAWEMSELWIAGSLIVLGVIAFSVRRFTPPLAASFYALAGVLHGYALAAAIVGAEATPLAAYFAGLTVIQAAMALGAWGASRWLMTRRPDFPARRAMGAAVGIAGLYFASTILIG
ncbi:MAG: HupE/UreJ family protein [Betaproteobacteria bacterium]